VLIGSIFYHGHKIVTNENTGEFKKDEAEKLINVQEEFSDKTGIPCMLDVIGSSGDALQQFIRFISEQTDAPFLVDSPSVATRIAGIRYAKEIGLEKKIIYNSLIPESKPEEFEAITDTGLDSAILLAYSGSSLRSADRVKAVKELLPKVEEAGVTKPIIDTFVLDLLSLSVACKTIIELKKEVGLPCGCGSHNAIATWRIKESLGQQSILPCKIAVNVIPISLGADFILYGPVEECRHVFPSVLAINTSYKFLNRMKDQLEI
jgi:tetrahydromethanopterin S-methyltransferase subunit H